MVRKPSISLTVERELLKNIDREKGDMNRSVFLSKIIAEHFKYPRVNFNEEEKSRGWAKIK